MRRAIAWIRHTANRYLGSLLPAKVITVQEECWCGTHHLGDYWHDPTYGRIDRDIQDRVAEMNPTSLGQRVAIENTLQERRDRGESI